MDASKTELVQANGTLTLILGGLVLVLGIWVLFLSLRLKKFGAIWAKTTAGGGREELESMLVTHADQQIQIQNRLEEALLRLDTQERKMQSAKRYVGLTRYNAFDDVGGEQSFALAVFDENGDGWVMSSLVGRESTRSYCKALRSGEAEQSLSGEEKTAIERASRSTGAKSR